jgi:hypothetical protein
MYERTCQVTLVGGILYNWNDQSVNKSMACYPLNHLLMGDDKFCLVLHATVRVKQAECVIDLSHTCSVHMTADTSWVWMQAPAFRKEKACWNRGAHCDNLSRDLPGNGSGAYNCSVTMENRAATPKM